MIVRSPDLFDRLWAKVEKRSPAECWPWLGHANTSGYGRLLDYGRVVLAHRVSFFIANGSIPDGMCVCHHCDNRLCVNPTHLFLGTPGDNNTDRHRKGRSGSHKGEANGRAKLTTHDVLAIRASTVRTGLLAQEYGVGLTAIREIRSRRMWKHLEPQDERLERNP